ncbi:hypothetical protein [Obesumbacterium proteus]|uniref:hypothetical protein n=1 Tax=Obesumbacterium proteus TaxID=82983 RepID=UPI002431B355|nr:hypothetical protein [Obesumbacterium proteus]
MEHVSHLVSPLINTAGINQASDISVEDSLIPTLMPPGIEKAAPESILSEESLLKRKAYTGYFIQHLIRFAISAASFGLAVAATVLSGGTGIPIAAVTGAAMLIAAGDTCCALYNLIQVRNDREPLQTNNDCIVFLVKKLMQNCCADHSAELAGDVASFTIRATISLSSVLLAQFLPAAHLSGSTAELLGDVSVGINGLLTVVGGLLDAHTAHIERRQRDVVKTINNNSENAQTQTDDSVVSDEMIQDMVSQVVACYERYRLEHHEFQASTA